MNFEERGSRTVLARDEATVVASGMTALAFLKQGTALRRNS